MKPNNIVRRRLSSVLFHVACLSLAATALYPILWMVASSFKPASDIFSKAVELWPSTIHAGNYAQGWKGFAGLDFGRFFANTFFVVILSSVGAVASSALAAYGLARIPFRFRGFWFITVILTMLLPGQLVTIPQYVIFHQLDWINTYLPLIVPSLFGTPFFIFLMVQFIRGIPVELDESAQMDGSTRWRTFVAIIVPLLAPALLTSAIFSFYWGWDNFLQPLIYLNNPAMYTVSVALRMFADPGTQTDWGAMFAMSTLSIFPPVLVFFLFQRYLVEGISTTGLKG